MSEFKKPKPSQQPSQWFDEYGDYKYDVNTLNDQALLQDLNNAVSAYYRQFDGQNHDIESEEYKRDSQIWKDFYQKMPGLFERTIRSGYKPQESKQLPTVENKVKIAQPTYKEPSLESSINNFEFSRKVAEQTPKEVQKKQKITSTKKQENSGVMGPEVGISYLGSILGTEDLVKQQKRMKAMMNSYHGNRPGARLDNIFTDKNNREVSAEEFLKWYSDAKRFEQLANPKFNNLDGLILDNISIDFDGPLRNYLNNNFVVYDNGRVGVTVPGQSTKYVTDVSKKVIPLKMKKHEQGGMVKRFYKEGGHIKKFQTGGDFEKALATYYKTVNGYNTNEIDPQDIIQMQNFIKNNKDAFKQTVSSAQATYNGPASQALSYLQDDLNQKIQNVQEPLKQSLQDKQDPLYNTKAKLNEKYGAELQFNSPYGFNAEAALQQMPVEDPQVTEEVPQVDNPIEKQPETPSLEDQMKTALSVTGNANRAKALGMSLQDYLSSDVRKAINSKYKTPTNTAGAVSQQQDQVVDTTPQGAVGADGQIHSKDDPHEKYREVSDQPNVGFNGFTGSSRSEFNKWYDQTYNKDHKRSAPYTYREQDNAFYKLNSGLFSNWWRQKNARQEGENLDSYDRRANQAWFDFQKDKRNLNLLKQGGNIRKFELGGMSENPYAGINNQSPVAGEAAREQQELQIITKKYQTDENFRKQVDAAYTQAKQEQPQQIAQLEKQVGPKIAPIYFIYMISKQQKREKMKMSRNGSKIECPDGYEVNRFKKGGRCIKCQRGKQLQQMQEILKSNKATKYFGGGKYGDNERKDPQGNTYIKYTKPFHRSMGDYPYDKVVGISKSNPKGQTVDRREVLLRYDPYYEKYDTVPAPYNPDVNSFNQYDQMFNPNSIYVQPEPKQDDSWFGKLKRFVGLERNGGSFKCGGKTKKRCKKGAKGMVNNAKKITIYDSPGMIDVTHK